MHSKNRQVVIGKYGRPKKRKGLRIKFRFSRKTFYLALIGMTFGGIFYFLFVSDRFEIKEIQISGLEVVDKEEVVSKINTVLNSEKFGFVKSKNYLLFSDDKLQAHIVKSFPKIASVNIGRVADRLDIAIKEREAVGIWCKSGVCFYFDKEGIIFEESPRSSGALIIVIEDERDIETKLGSAVLTSKEISFATYAHGFISRNFSFSLRTFLIAKDGQYEILTSENWLVFLSRNETPEYQLSNLKYVLDGEIKNRRGELEYIDLRLGNKVYYKKVHYK